MPTAALQEAVDTQLYESNALKRDIAKLAQTLNDTSRACH